MKAVILAGGLGARLSEETSVKPKPMVETGGKPILWHIMRDLCITMDVYQESIKLNQEKAKAS
jgi:NDP-sugar pyrophosphorylase family protein